MWYHKSIESLNHNSAETKKILNEIKFILQQVSIMGFNDSEIFELNQLIKKVNLGEIDPESALSRAYDIKEKKQDYH